jgi:hypothetical protein
LALLVGIDEDAGKGTLPIEPKVSLLALVRVIRQAIGAGEPWPIYGSDLEEHMDLEITKHRGEMN